METLEEALGPELGARVIAIVVQHPPAHGDLVELAPDKRSLKWRDAHGTSHKLEFEPPIRPMVFWDEAEDDDTGWENEPDGPPPWALRSAKTA